ncbi:hypothetical protein M8371_29540, partial [Klebsiella pneumoniae]|nr:hypothetical protein [Klebsiella pneumoniae]
KRAYCLKTQPATGETYPKSDLFNKALVLHKQGLSNREIGIKLGGLTGSALTNQAISKALGTIRDEFIL